MAVIKVLPQEEMMVGTVPHCESNTSSTFAKLSISERRRKFSPSPTSVVDQPPTKRVRFSTTCPIEVSHEISKEERKETNTWYDKGDFKCFVQHAASFALKQKKAGNSSKSLERTFVSCFFHQPSSITNVTTETIQYAYQQAAIDEDNCSSTNGVDTSRGIETLSSPSLIGGVAKSRRKNTIRSVVKAYKKNVSRRRRQGGQVSSNDDDDDETLLRQISEYHSRPAKHFALAMGFVDALSVLAAQEK